MAKILRHKRKIYFCEILVQIILSQHIIEKKSLNILAVFGVTWRLDYLHTHMITHVISEVAEIKKNNICIELNAMNSDTFT